jgi:hypothetical protein
LQEDAGRRRGRLGAGGAADQEPAAEQDDPHERSAMTLPPIAADARKAGREHLTDKRDPLGRVLLDPEEEYGKDNEAAARADPEKSRREAPDEADRDAIKQTMGIQLLAPSAYANERPNREIGTGFFATLHLIDGS